MCNYISKGGILWRSHGSLTYDTKIDKSGFEKGINSLTGTAKNAGTKIKSIITALGITKLISTAISTINNSIDGAVSRLDTLNNFPKVMSNLGIASEESSKAIDTLSKGLQGLPTKLDAGALAVQRFTSKNGDVNKSVDLFLAINNALLAGGASAEIQETALEQLSQAYAKGKPDMMEWRSIQTAMPAQLNQVAKAFNMTSDELGEALRSGKISMDEFMQKVVELNKNGVNGFKSFEEQAKNSVGGIKTSITNAKTAITRGVANIVNSVDRSLKKTSLGGLSKTISNIGSIAEKWLRKISNLIEKIDFNSIIKKIQNTFTLNGSKIKDVFSSIGKIINNLISIVKNFMPVIEPVIDAFFSLINVIGKVGVILSEFLKYITSNILGLTDEKKAIHDLIREQESQVTTWEKLKEAREQSLSASSQEIATTQSLAKELKNITDENGKVKEGYENRAKYILGELNKALGTEYTMNGNIISQYEDLKNNIDQLIAKKKAEVTLDAYKQEYQKALTEQSNATKELAELTKAYNKQLKIANDTSKTISERNDAKTQAKNLEESINKQQNLISEYGYTLEKYNNLTSASISGNAEEINKAISEITTSYDKAKAKADSSLSSQVQAQTEYVNLIEQNLKKAKESNDRYSEDILQSELKTQKEQLNNLVKSFTERTSTIEDLSSEEVTAWATLARNSTDEYNTALSEMPEDTREKIENAIDRVKTSETLLTGKFSTLGDNSTRIFSNELKLKETIQDKMSQAGTSIRDDTSVSRATAILATETSNTFKDNANSRKWGNDLISNLVNSISSGKFSVRNAITGIADTIHSVIGHSVPKEGPLKDELTYMPDMIDNLVNGIEKNKYKVTRAVQGLSSDMEKRLQNVVNLEVGRMNATATVKSNAMYNSVIQINANFDGNVEMDSTRVGRLVAPSVTRTIKAGGLA